MSDPERRQLQEAIIAPCQFAVDDGHMDAVFAALGAAFAALILASGLPIEDALALHNEQVREHLNDVARARAAAKTQAPKN